MNFNPAILRNNLMHAKIMEWTNDDALDLIEQYRTHTELWNRADPKYKDKLCRFRAWSEIAERFGCSKAEVERKMNVLLTQYRREKHKMLVKLYQGIQPNPSKWYAFKRFDFMEAGGGSSSGSNSSMINIMHHHHHLANSGNGGSGANGSSAPLGMVAGGDNGGVGGSNGFLLSTNNTHNSSNNIAGGSNINLTTNGHLHHHLHHSAAAVAASAALNGLAVAGYESATAAAASAMPTTSHHRRMKSKEMKYFGAMRLNLPMLLANSQPLDNWSAVGQYSPSPALSERQQQQLHVPLSMQFSAPQNNLNSGGGFFSGNSASESPQKPMDTNDEMDGIEEKVDVNENKCESRIGTTPTPTNLHDAITSIAINTSSSNSTTNHHLHQNDGRLDNVANGTTEAGLAGQLSRTDNGDRLKSSGRSGAASTENNNGSSPIPNTYMHEAHKQQRHLLSGSSIMTASGGNLTTSQDADNIEIKQELHVDYFHAPHPPAAPDSHLSYSSTDDNRHGSDVADEYAQDLRVSAAATAAAKGLDFNRFVLPTGLRRSREYLEEKFSTVNMRKLNSGTNIASSAAAAGHMLMNSLLSNESNSEDNSGRRKSGSTGDGATAATQDVASSAAAAAAVAFYVESLNKDDCDYVGSNVSVKLRTMDRTQRIIAEKLISEVLFYGQFNELERSARIQPK